MKRFLEDELTLSDVKSIAKKMNRKHSGWLIALTVLGIASAIAAVVFAVLKIKEHYCCDCDDYDDDDFDDDYDDDYDDDDASDNFDSDDDESDCPCADDNHFEK